ncbi:histidine phosphatase family protein [Candidatus Woesearchaeota archaeon]|nr:histidine phosphatase family protein [Candidatus Woesearchaeota archaeon]
MLEQICIARHGNYGSDDRISDEGKNQMRTLASALKECWAGLAPITLLTSTAPRAQDSAEVLGSILAPATIASYDCLWSGNDSKHTPKYGDLPAVHALVAEHRTSAKGIILVTHLEVSEDYPSHFFQTELKREQHFKEIRKGSAYLIDTKTGQTRLLP